MAISSLNSNPEEEEKAKKAASKIWVDGLQFSTKVKKSLADAIANFGHHSGQHRNAIENQLPRELMRAHLVRGTEGASVYSSNPLKSVAVKFIHFARKREFIHRYNESFPVKLTEIEARNPTAFEIKCLTAVLKRYSIPDFDAANLGYEQLMAHLQMALFLIRKVERTLCENVNLLTPMLLSNIDKKTFNEPSLRQGLPIKTGFFSQSKYKTNLHFAVKDTLLSLEMLATKTTDATRKQRYIIKIQALIVRIISFYINHLILDFSTNPLLLNYLEEFGNKEKQELLDLIVKIINKELGDETPADYYKAALAGISLFRSELGERGNIKLELDQSHNITIIFSVLLSSPGSEMTKEIITSYPGHLADQASYALV